MCRKPKRGSEAEAQRRRRSTMRTRFVTTFSFICCTLSVTITFLCLFSGNRTSYMWDSPVVSINTTLLGYDLLQTNTSSLTRIKARAIQTTPDSNTAANLATAPVNASALRLSSTNVLADLQSAELGIQQWYSFNILSVCEGRYYPSAFVPGTNFGSGSCASATPMRHFNFTAYVQQELKTGQLNATLLDLGWRPSMQRGLDSANAYLEAAFILYVFSVVFLLATMIPSAIVVFLTSTYASLSPKIWLLSVISFLLTLSAAATMTAFSHDATSTLNTLGNPINISASQGLHFLALSWTNVGLTAIVSLIWALEVYLKRRETVRETMRLHQEHYERARIWGKIGALEEEEPVCSCVDPWKVLARPRYCGHDEAKGGKVPRETEMETASWEGEDPWVGVSEKVLVVGK